MARRPRPLGRRPAARPAAPRRDDAHLGSRPAPLGSRRYLGSGAVRGIGPALAAPARRAPSATAVFRVIEERAGPPARGRRDRPGAPGDASSRRGGSSGRCARSWCSCTATASRRAAPSASTRPTASQAIETVQHDPYRLARDIRGIGFLTADRIAERLGVDRHSELRARAGVEHVLLELTDDGHCAFPREALVERAAGMLEIPAADRRRGARRTSWPPRRLVRRRRRRRGAARLPRRPRRRRADRRRHARRPRARPPPAARRSTRRRRSRWVEAPTRTRRSPPSSARAVELAARREGAGHHRRPGRRQDDDRPGDRRGVRRRSGLRVGPVRPDRPRREAARRGDRARPASTIHRLLEVDPPAARFKHDADRPLDGDLVVVDETSMIDLPLAAALVRAVPRHAALVLVGDVDQLPLGRAGVRARATSSTPAWCPVCRLTEVFRQAAASRIVANAHRVNRGDAPERPRRQGRGDGRVDDFFFVDARTTRPAPLELLVKLVTDLDPAPLRPRPRPRHPGAHADAARRARRAQPEPGAAGGAQPGPDRRSSASADAPPRRQGDADRERLRQRRLQRRHRPHRPRSTSRRRARRRLRRARGRLHLRRARRAARSAYAVTIHKAQGSEYPAVVDPAPHAALRRCCSATSSTPRSPAASGSSCWSGTRRALAIAVRRVRRGSASPPSRSACAAAFAADDPSHRENEPRGLPLAAEPPSRYRT